MNGAVLFLVILSAAIVGGNMVYNTDWNLVQIKAVIKTCEEKLPRNQHCEITFGTKVVTDK